MKLFNLKEGKFPLLITPNLGRPQLLNLQDFLNKMGKLVKMVTFKAYLITYKNQSIQDILEYYYKNLFIVPILEDEGDFQKRRGSRIPLHIKEINKVNKEKYKEQRILSEEGCLLYDMDKNVLSVEDVFGKRETIYRVKIKVKKIQKIVRMLDELGKDFLLFDIVHDVPNRMEDKINFHALAIFNKDWSNFRFIHATDFHIARRNDFIIDFMKKKVKNRLKVYKARPKKLKKVDTTILTRDFEFQEEFQEEKLEDIKYSKFNFNYSLRLLIEFINKKVKQNKLDFVLMTGDLVDYIDIARGNYQYQNNYRVFIEILLGVNRGLEKPPLLDEEEFINRREILAPIFTILGNHDYRKGHYSIRSGSVHKIFGLRKKDYSGYYDIKFFNYFKALYSRDNFLRDYFRYINPSLNYRIKIGDKINFIFLDTGQDSIADMHDLLKGSPSTKGIKDYQIDILRDYIKLCHNERIILVMHTPPVSPNLNIFKRFKIKRLLKLKRKLDWTDFYEENLRKKTGEARLDKIFNLKYQTIMYNWATFLKICVGSDKVIRRKVDVILCGHTHTLKEFRLKEARETENINLGFYIVPIVIDVPCEVYTSNYRKVFEEIDDEFEFKVWFDVNKPFIFQTQGIGPISLKLKYKPPGFRYIYVKNNHLRKFKIFSLYLKEKEEKELVE